MHENAFDLKVVGKLTKNKANKSEIKITNMTYATALTSRFVIQSANVTGL